MVKTWVPRYFPMQEELENFAVLMKKQKLWPFVHVTLKWTCMIDFSYGFCLCGKAR